MSIIGTPIMVGGGGGFWPSLRVDGLSSTDAVTATKGSTTLTAEWKAVPDSTTSAWYFDRIPEFGTWTVTATDGTKTTMQEVLVDVATEYAVTMSYGFYTDFSEKLPGWTEEGGTFSYGDGLYLLAGASHGTLELATNYTCRSLTIPYFAAAPWTWEVSVVIQASSGGMRGEIYLYLRATNDSSLVEIRRGDYWADTNQGLIVNVAGEEAYTTGEVNNLNGVTQNVKITYDGSTLKAFIDNSQVYSGAHSLADVAEIEVRMCDYTGNTSPYRQVEELKLIPEVTT